MIEWLTGILCLSLGLCSDQPCRDVDHKGVVNVVCSYRLDQVSLELFHANKDGKPYGSLRALKREIKKPPLMLANGGMYHDDLSPVGLYTDKSGSRTELSTKAGWGNFHLLPNGVFWIANGKAGVSETKAFAKAKRKVDYATQSGPMLVIDGKLHPRFLRNSDSRKIRNGVGVSRNGHWIHFVQSRRSTTFWEFGTLFKDILETPNALFLDGTVSTLETPDVKLGGWRALGPIIGVFSR